MQEDLEFLLGPGRTAIDGSKTGGKEEKESHPNPDAVAADLAKLLTPVNLLPRQAKPYDPKSDEANELDLAESANADYRKGGSFCKGWDLDEASEKEIREVTRVFADQRENGGTFVPSNIRRIVKNGDEAIVLSQILYSFDEGKGGLPRAQAQWEGRRFLAQTHEELGKEIGIERRRVRDCLASLKKQGFIRIEYHRFGKNRVSHIRPVLSAVVKALNDPFDAGGRLFSGGTDFAFPELGFMAAPGDGT